MLNPSPPLPGAGGGGAHLPQGFRPTSVLMHLLNSDHLYNFVC
uniref:Uncharacterized protein n=1 Tax=Anguilla anguilla TaxID=7936 RepID=A0A0E9Q0K6_ANGAN